MYQALYRKWRPNTFSDVIGQPHVTETLRHQLTTGRISHAYLFVGTRGTGKTSCAKILAKAVNCEQLQDGDPCNTCPACVGIEGGGILDVEELDAASNNGVDHVRALRDEAIFTPAVVRKRVYIVDEVHMLSTAAFNALLKILEEPPAHLMFILATTEVHKVPATILSRCQRYAFRRVGATDIAGRLHTVAAAEGLELQEDAGNMLARLADGSMRDALALLDQCATGRAIDIALVQAFVGLTGTQEVAKLLTAIGNQDADGALQIVNSLYYAGRDMGALLGELGTLLRDVLLTRIAPKGATDLLSGSFDRAVIETFTTLPPETLLFALGQVTDAMGTLARSTDRKLTVEITLIRLCDMQLSENIDALQARVARLEQQVTTGVSVQIQPPAPVQPTPPATPVPPPKAEPEPEPEAPPWDVPPPPEEAPPPPEEPPAPIEPSAPKVETPPTTGNGTWRQILDKVQPQLDVSMFSLISDSKEVTTTLDSGTCNIYIENDFTRLMAETPEVLAAIEKAATQVTGQPTRAKIHAGPPAERPAVSKLDALTQKGFGNITIK